MALAPDTILQARYRIVRQLGQGGMGTVYEALDARLNAPVALKETFFSDERLRKQFEREAQLLARLHHPALPRVSDHFNEGDGQFLVMQFIAGDDLWEMLHKQGSAFPPDKVLIWADQLLDALDYLHSQDPPIIHRDIKPQNLKLTGRNQVILLDFGLAKGFAGQISRVTTSGSIFGYTPNYAPLEQIQGTGTDVRSDLYSLAATLYHLLTGRVPPDALSRVTAIMSERPDPLRLANEVNEAVPTLIADILHQAMSNNPSKRPVSADEMRQALQSVRQTLPTGISQTSIKDLPLPSTVHAPASSVKAQENEAKPLPPTVLEPIPARKRQEFNSTVASPTMPHSAAATPAIEKVQSKQTVRKSNHRWWIIGSLVALIAVVILIISLSANKTNNNTKSNRTILSKTKLTNSGRVGQAVLSPDGRYIAYTEKAEGTRNINLLLRESSTSSGAKVLTTHDSYYTPDYLTFSSDSKFLYYATGQALYQVATQGGEPKKLADLPSCTSKFSLSPDGKRLACMHTSREVSASGYNDYYSLKVMNIADNSVQELIKRPIVLTPPEWSPDSKLLAYSSSSKAGQALMTINADGTGEQTLYSFSAYSLSSTMFWSPDGKLILFDFGVLRVDDRTTTTNLTNEREKRFNIENASWLSDSSGFIITGWASDGGQLFQVSYPSGEIRKITNDSNIYGRLSLSADSNILTTVQTDDMGNSDVVLITFR